MAGGLLTLVVVATGVLRRALLAVEPDTAIPPEAVVIYGLVFVALLGLFYVAASSAIDGRARRFVDEFAPLPDPSDENLSERLRRRDDLATLVGSGGAWRSFETTVVIAGPLLTALIGSATGS